jgi:hypothetical protein
MNYDVKLITSNNIHVGVKNTTIKKSAQINDTNNINVGVNNSTTTGSVQINTAPTAPVISSNITVDPTNRQNNSILVYDSDNNIHKYLQPQQLIDLADGSLDNAIDYGSY